MQLPLPVTLPTNETFDSFVAGPNAELTALLKSIITSCHAGVAREKLPLFNASSLPLVNMVGGKGKGKTHLLFASCHLLQDLSLTHTYLNFAEFSMLSPRVLDGLEHLSVICLDNIHAVAGMAEWEESLFDLLTRVQESTGTAVLCTSSIGPSHPDFSLPDLKSRLSWGATYRLKNLTDEERKLAVRRRGEQKGLLFSDLALRFLLNHADRKMDSLMSLVERLDTRSLVEKKKLSVAMIKRELDLN